MVSIYTGWFVWLAGRPLWSTRTIRDYVRVLFHHVPGQGLHGRYCILMGLAIKFVSDSGVFGRERRIRLRVLDGVDYG